MVETPIDAVQGTNSTVVQFLYNPVKPGVPNNTVKPDPYVTPYTVNRDAIFDDKLVAALIKKINDKHPEETIKAPSAAVKALQGKKLGDIMKDNKIEFKSLNGLLTTVEDTGAGQAPGPGKVVPAAGKPVAESLDIRAHYSSIYS